MEKATAVRIYRTDRAASPLGMRRYSDDLWSLTFSPEGSHIATVSRSKTVTAWRVDSPASYVPTKDEPAKSATFNSDGTHLVIGSEFDAALIRAADGSGPVERKSGIPVLYVAYNPLGSQVVTASEQILVKVLGPDDKINPSHPAAAVKIDPQSEAWSPDLSRLAVGYADGTIRIWPTNGLEEPILLKGHQNSVTSVSYSPDGTRVVSASEDGTARIWSADGVGEPLVLEGHTGPVTSAVFSPEGDRVLTASTDGTVRSWRVTWRALMKYVRRSLKLCLSSDQRIQYLGETAPIARSASEACKRNHG